MNPDATSDSISCDAALPFAPADGAGGPSTLFSQESAPDAPSNPGPSPYTAPYTGPSSPYTGPYSAPSSPYSGPSSPSSLYSGGQTFPALPASSGGSIVPGAGDPVKKPFPWWIVIATVILS